MAGIGSYLLVAAGGAMGASLRFGVGQAVLRLAGPGFPLATMIVNILGSFLMGLLVGWLAARSSGGNPLFLLAGTGALGGFTTFSTFALDGFTLYERGASQALAFYVIVSVGAALLAVFGGLMLARAVFS